MVAASHFQCSPTSRRRRELPITAKSADTNQETTALIELRFQDDHTAALLQMVASRASRSSSKSLLSSPKNQSAESSPVNSSAVADVLRIGVEDINRWAALVSSFTG